MKSLVERLSSAFDIRQGEQKLVLLLLTRSFFIGVVQTLSATVATTLFLEQYSTQELPLVYIGAAFFAPVAGMLHYKLTQRASYLLGASASLGLIFFALLTFINVDNLFPGSKIMPLLFYIWYFAQDAFIYNEFWALVDRAFDVRQAKRLSGLVATGDMIARIITGLSISALIHIVGGVLQLLIPAAVCLLLSILFLIVISSIWNLNRPFVQTRKAQRHDVNSYRQILKNPYIVMIVFLSIITMVVFYFVDITFISETRLFFPQQETLAVFLGYFEAFVSLATMFCGMFLARPIIARYGATGGLLALPLASGLGAALILFLASENQTLLIVFLSIALLKILFNSIRASIHVPSYRVLIYPLLQGEQERTHTLIEVIVEPAVGGVTGFILLRLVFNEIYFSRIILILALIWVVIVLFLNYQYAGALKRALGLRVLGGSEISLGDVDSKKIIENGLQSDYAGEVIYGLDLLEQNLKNEQDILPVYLNLLNHSDWEVRKNVLLRMEKPEFRNATKEIKHLLQNEKRSEVRGTALRLLAMLGGPEGVEDVQKMVSRDNWSEFEEAIVGALKSGEIEGILWGGTHLLKLERSEIVEERIHAARIIGKAAIDNFYRPLVRMMQDDESRVRVEAILSAGKLKNTHLWMIMIQSLREDAFIDTIIAALAEGGDAVIELMRQMVAENPPQRNQTIGLLKVCGRIRGQKAIDFLKKYLYADDFEIAYQASVSLRLCEYRGTGKDLAHIKTLIKNQAGKTVWYLAVLTDLNKDDALQLLYRGIEERLARGKEFLFSCLMFIYGSASLGNAWKILYNDRWSHERRVYALETVDAILGAEYKEMLLPLFEGISYSEQLKKLSGFFPQKKMQPLQRLQEIILAPDEVWSIWLKACAFKTLSVMNIDIYTYHIHNILEQGKGSQTWGDIQTLMNSFDKVSHLQTIEMFSHVPGYVLADLAAKMQEENFSTGQPVFSKGDAGDRMYLIQDGKVLVHDGMQQIAVRGKGDVIGEMAILDPQPRSASVTAIQESVLLSIDQETFFDILANQVEVTRAVLKMLSRRLAEIS